MGSGRCRASWHGSTADLRHPARQKQCAEASTRWVRYLRVSEEVVEGTIVRPWSGVDHPVEEGERVSRAGLISGTTTATIGRSSTSVWLLTRGMWRVG